MKHDYIDIDKTQLPFRFEWDSENDSFFIDIEYNESHDFFTATLYDAMGNLLVAGEKLVLNMPLFNEIIDPESMPAEDLIPLDESGQAQRITWDNFGMTVFLCIDDLPDDSEDDSGPTDDDKETDGFNLDNGDGSGGD
ncbi:phage baseplate plug family protein [Sporolactobacillus laevolacticus]|uniref:Cyanophage baseplate Pam3 plug gp18 domain-containing protein n=1 Tax=Sporolactobacillus laevolacticus DSM 442 TaxID=1395513 RepID=V6IXH0_9BACL|nr:hypothetical protein [Sporolactobacillus laevolacticus]EST12042.1 hypothetical protein P343_07915 [Sporolactobacillus laevolacticus DSM 442]